MLQKSYQKIKNCFSKTELRKQILSYRAHLTQKWVDEHSKKIQERFLASSIWQEAHVLTLYLALPGEVTTDLLLTAASEAKKTVYVPRILQDQPGCMEFVRYTADMQLSKTKFGLLEPAPIYPAVPKFAPDLFCIPALAFSQAGDRLGFGKGYYDRYLAQYPTATRVGLCFSWQILPKIPIDPWDLPMHYLVNEEELLCR